MRRISRLGRFAIEQPRDAEAVDEDRGRDTLGWAVKNHDDLRRVEAALPELLRD